MKKEKRLRNEKLANRKLGKVRDLGNLRKIIPSFLISEFSTLPYSQNRKLGFENLGKFFSRFPRFPRLPSFDLVLIKLTVKTSSEKAWLLYSFMSFHLV